MNLSGKAVVLCVTGSIAAYKAADLTSRLRKQGADVWVIMTRAASEFVAPLTFETLSGHPVARELFQREQPWEVEHIALAKRADVFVVAPATANLIAKAANGVADDMAISTLLATRAPLVFAPAMNTGMYDNPATQDNMERLRARGALFVEPAAGRLACGDEGRGRLADVAQIEQAIAAALTKRDCEGLSVLVTAGPTQEALDPVRYLTNHSTGKMGYALAAQAAARGARVTLIAGPTTLETPPGVCKIPVTSAREMYEAVLARLPETDWVLKAAAVGDYRPAEEAADKLKKSEADRMLQLTRNPDILAEIGARKRPGQLVCGFAMETRDLLAHAREKLERKHCDLMVANSLRTEGAGFGTDTNVATLLYRDGRTEPVEKMTKAALADRILDRLLAMRGG